MSARVQANYNHQPTDQHSEEEFEALFQLAQGIKLELDDARATLDKYATFKRENDSEVMELCAKMREICEDKLQRADKDLVLIMLLAEGLCGERVSARINMLLGANEQKDSGAPKLRRTPTGRVVPQIKDEGEKVQLDRLEDALVNALHEIPPEKGVTTGVARLRTELVEILIQNRDASGARDQQRTWDEIVIKLENITKESFTLYDDLERA